MDLLQYERRQLGALGGYGDRGEEALLARVQTRLVRGVERRERLAGCDRLPHPPREHETRGQVDRGVPGNASGAERDRRSADPFGVEMCEVAVRGRSYDMSLGGLRQDGLRVSRQRRAVAALRGDPACEARECRAVLQTFAGDRARGREVRRVAGGVHEPRDELDGQVRERAVRFATQYCDSLLDLERVAHGHAERLVHVGHKAAIERPNSAPRLGVRACELERLLGRLHERAGAAP